MNDQDPKLLLTQRLRELRAERRLTQRQLALALGGVSIPLISSWESETNPRVPPLERLTDYATLFAAPRCFAQKPARLLKPEEMSDEELRAMRELKDELERLRGKATAGDPSATGRRRSPGAAESLHPGPWHFDDEGDITIVCAQWPQDMLTRIPYTKEDDPDYIELLTFSDLDALFELYGRLNAVNPTSKISRQVAHKLTADDYSSHLITLGGTDWNEVTRSTLRDLELPVQLVADWGTQGGQYFEAHNAETVTQHPPVLEDVHGQTILREDVGLFARAMNPFNQERTITICTGMYGRGGYGVVRALTDVKFRNRNAGYLQSRFGSSSTYCILTRVPIANNGTTLTPDWTISDYRLFEWGASDASS